MKNSLRTAAALGFIGFLIVIIAIADRGEGDRWWSFIGAIPYGDKVGHLGLMGMLSLLCNLAFRPPQPGFLPRWVTLTTCILLVALSLEELSQALNPHRTCDWYDWLADLAGLALGQWIAFRLRPLQKSEVEDSH